MTRLELYKDWSASDVPFQSLRTQNPFCSWKNLLSGHKILNGALSVEILV
jgi:hypothetical protein